MKSLILLLITLLTATGLKAQDTIIKMSGEEITAKVTEITLSEISYKHVDSLKTIPHTIPKKEVFMIKYANGVKEVFNTGTPTNANTVPDTPANHREMYEKGQQDARKYYRGNGALVGSAFGTLVSIFIPIAIAAIPPKTSNINIPDKTLLLNQDYRYGLQRQAHRRKVGKAATGVGITIAVSVAVVAAVIGSM